MLLAVRDELAPEFLAVTFDHPSPTFRHTMYVGYQHGRVKDRQMEEDIWGQVEKLKEHLGEVGVAVYQIEGFEADDVIGTLATQASGQSKSKIPHFAKASRGKQKSKIKIDGVVIVTGDRDLLQLVNERVKVFMPVKGLSETVLLDRKGVREKMGVWPEEIVDYKGLVGDSSDNYPGVVGIGPKTAATLIEKYGGVEKVYRSMAKVKKELGEVVVRKLIEGQEGAQLSKALAKIRVDSPVSLDLETARMPTDEKLIRLFDQMKYPSLVKRITGESGVETEKFKLKSKSKHKKAEGQMELV
jgi:DNA polymerase-1